MDRYYTACIPEPVTICGHRLKPFSIGHSIILKRWENAFVTKKETLELSDLAIAAMVCSRDYGDALLCLDSYQGKEEFKAILKSSNRIFKESCAAMIQYMQDARQHPENVDWKESKPCNVAPEAMLKHALMAKLGYSEERALSMPYGQAIYEFCVWQHAEGMASFYDVQERQDLQAEADAFELKRKEMSLHG